MSTHQQETSIVVMGLDKSGHPRAVTYPPDLKQMASDAASHWGLQIGRVVGDKGLAIAKDLPNGTLFPPLKMLPPTIKRATYNALLKVVGFDNKSAKTNKQKDKSAIPASAWDSIVPGSIVLHQETGDEGYYACKVISITGDRLTLKWRDYPELPLLKGIRRNEVALIQIEK